MSEKPIRLRIDKVSSAGSLLQKFYEALRSVLAQVAKKRELEVSPEFAIGVGTYADFALHTKGDLNDIKALIETKVGDRGDYLPWATYGQLLVYRKVLKEWQGIRPPLMMVVTNQQVAPDLAGLLQSAGVVIVQVPPDLKDAATVMEKEIIHALDAQGRSSTSQG